MKVWKTIGLATLAALAAIQLVTCDHANAAVVADLRAPPEVKSALRRACYDCHSNETTWKWYSRVAPVSWLIYRDVEKGRAALNFSNWDVLSADLRSKLRRECGEEIAEGEMPPSLYTPLHPDAVLSSADKLRVETWARGTETPANDDGKLGAKDDR